MKAVHLDTQNYWHILGFEDPAISLIFVCLQMVKGDRTVHFLVLFSIKILFNLNQPNL